MSQAHDNGAVITVGCHFCRTKRHYLPADLMRLLGDIEIHTMEHRSPCDGCGRKDYVVVRIWHPLREERIGLIIRRLERVVRVRRAVWRNEPLD